MAIENRNLAEDSLCTESPDNGFRLKDGIDSSDVSSVALKRLIDEVQEPEFKAYGHDRYDRTYHRHNRGA